MTNRFMTADERNMVDEPTFYDTALNKADFGWEATGYGHPINQKMRFDLIKNYVLSRETPGSFSVLDVGCGTGDLLIDLIESQKCPHTYEGIDIMQAMVDRAEVSSTVRLEHLRQDRHTLPGEVEFEHGDISKYKAGHPDAEFDYVVSVAAYAIKEPELSMMETTRQVQEDIELMASLAIRSVAVTLFSPWKTEIAPNEMVIDPATMFAWAKTNWERVDLIHSYAPFDYTLIIRNDDSDWRKAWNQAHQ